MRKNLYFLMAVAAMASVSCLKEDFNAEQQPQIPADAVTITAVAENDAALKTSLSEGKVLWHNGDAVSVWNGSAMCQFVTADPDGSESVKFGAISSEYQPADSYLALYPHSSEAVFADGKVSATVPAIQEAYAGGFAKDVNVAVASGSGESLLFRNVCGYVKFTVPAGMTDLTKVEFAANNPQESLAGNVSVTIADEPSAAVTSEGSASVSLEGTFEAGASYYIAVLPQTLSEGFTITMTRGGKTSTMSTTKSFTVNRSKAKPVGELYNGVWQVRLEGSSVPEGQTLKLTQTLENANLFACLETLNAGKLNLKVLYENVYIATEGGAYTDGGETAYTTADEACDFDIAAEGLYRIVLNKETGKLIIYSPETNPKNASVTYNNTVDKINPYTQEVTSLWMYGTFNGSVQDGANCPMERANCQFECKYRLIQSLANPCLFVYYNEGKALPRYEKVFQSWDNVKYMGGVNFYVSNIQNNVYAYGSTAEAKRDSKTGAVECSLGESSTAVAGQSDNRYALFLIPEGANYVEVDIQNLTVLFDKRNTNEQTSDSSNSADDSSPRL